MTSQFRWGTCALARDGGQVRYLKDYSGDGRLARGAGQRLDCPKLLVKRHEVKVVPGLNDLSVLNPHDRHSRDFHGSVGGSKSEAVARVFTAHQTTHCDFVVCA